MKRPLLIVIGGLNTDITANGIRNFPKPGEHVYGKQLRIGPGGKSRNIAAMAGVLLSRDQVAMIGRTAQDSFGLWKLPLQALDSVGVNTDFVHVVNEQSTDKLPAIALITVNVAGENQIVFLPGISEDFGSEDIDSAESLFNEAAASSGLLCATLECPIKTVAHAFDKARAKNIRIVFDPGGIESKEQVSELLRPGVFLIKPNEHEAQIITDIPVNDELSAHKAANKIMQMGAENVLITHGAKGAYLFTPKLAKYLPVDNAIVGETKDATGCGDQVMATLCACLQNGKDLEVSARIAVTSGTLQFHRSGVVPVDRGELISYGYSI